MAALLFRGWILLDVLLLSACIPAINHSEIKHSVVTKKFESTPRKTFLLAHADYGLSRQFHDGYMETIAAEFIKLGTTVEMARVTGLELDKNSHVRQILDFRPDAFIVVKFNLREIYNGLNTGEISLNLSDYRDHKEIWRSFQTFKISGGLSSDHGIKLAKEAFQKLSDTGALSGFAEANK
jgi:hypothetical protein